MSCAEPLLMTAATPHRQPSVTSQGLLQSSSSTPRSKYTAQTINAPKSASEGQIEERHIGVSRVGRDQATTIRKEHHLSASYAEPEEAAFGSARAYHSLSHRLHCTTGVIRLRKYIGGVSRGWSAASSAPSSARRQSLVTHGAHRSLSHHTVLRA